MTNDRNVAASSSGFCAPLDVRHSCFVISCRVILMLIFQTCFVALTNAQSPNVIGKWNVEITFANANQRSLRFDARDAGKGSFLLLSRDRVWGTPASLRRQSGVKAIKNR